MLRSKLLVALIGLGFVATACSVETVEPTGDSDKDKDKVGDTVSGDADKDAGTDTGTGTGTGNNGNTGGNTGTGGSTGTATCTSQPDFQACANCFAGQMPEGSQAYSQLIVEHCICANECQEVCTASCEDPTSAGSEECNTCMGALTQEGACIQAFGTACQADSNCTQFISALQACPQ